MRFYKTIITLTIITAILGYNKYLFSWGLFDLFADTSFSRKGLKKTINFNPDTDIFYLPSLEHKALFQSIEDLSICRKQEVRKYIYLYLTSAREYTKKAILLSYKYQHIIKPFFKNNKDIPEELALLPLLESGFNPHALSRSKAMGLWQFMKATGKALGLRINPWVDERRDIEKSTIAAIRHLRHLKKQFGSWGLALAAYNGGSGHVNRAIKKSGTKDIWKLQRSGYLHQETSEYLPKYIALLLIYKHQSLFNIQEELYFPTQFPTENVSLKYSVQIKALCRKINVSERVLRAYNPELKGNFTPPYEKGYSLRIPSSSTKHFLKKEKKLYRYKIRGASAYKIRKGDCLSKIAVRFKKKLRFS